MFINWCALQSYKFDIMWSKHNSGSCPQSIKVKPPFRLVLLRQCQGRPSARWELGGWELPFGKHWACACQGGKIPHFNPTSTRYGRAVLGNLESRFPAWKAQHSWAAPKDLISLFWLWVCDAARSCCWRSQSRLGRQDFFSSYLVHIFKGFITCCVQRDIVCDSISCCTTFCNYVIIKYTELVYCSLYIKPVKLTG